MSKLKIEAIDSGVSFTVKVSAGSRKNEFRGIHDGMLKVCVTQVAEKSKANTAVIALLAKRLNICKQDISIQSGATSSVKRLHIAGLSMDLLSKALGAL